jgi:hypothetical protein
VAALPDTIWLGEPRGTVSIAAKCFASSPCRECSGCYLVRVGVDALSMAANSLSLSSSVRAREFCRT